MLPAEKQIPRLVLRSSLGMTIFTAERRRLKAITQPCSPAPEWYYTREHEASRQQHEETQSTARLTRVSQLARPGIFAGGARAYIHSPAEHRLDRRGWQVRIGTRHRAGAVQHLRAGGEAGCLRPRCP